MVSMLLAPVLLEAAALEKASEGPAIRMVSSEFARIPAGRVVPGTKDISVSGDATIASVFVQQEVEPNNTINGANLMDNSRLRGGEYALVGTITTVANDVDYYRFQVTTGGLVFFVAYWDGFYLNKGQEGDLYLTLYDSAGKLLFTQKTYGTGADMFCAILEYINAGTYYLRVSATTSKGTTYVGNPYVVLTDFYRDTTISDSNLKNALRVVLPQTEGRNITELDMWQLVNLELINKGIRNLTGMQDALNLEHLQVGSNQITNLIPLNGLTELYYLDVSNNPNLADFSPLASCSTLEYLAASGTSVADISALSSLQKLIYLQIGGDWFQNLSQLTGFTKLTNLIIINSPLIDDLTPLAGMTSNLEYLVVRGTLATDITPLMLLPNLWCLDVSGNRISDISPIRTMLSAVVEIDVSDNEIQDIGPIVDLCAGGTALPENSWVNVSLNDLDLNPDSQANADITYLQNQQVEVVYLPQKSVARIAGANRYRTAIAVSREGWLNGSDTVILARGDNFADALAGVPLAYQLDAPILLNAQSQLNPLVLAEIQRLGATKVVILGGTGALSAGVATALQNAGLTVQRLAGGNRYDTAVQIAKEMKTAGANFSGAIVAVGTNFPDALAAASYAAMNGQPILLTASKSLPAETAAALAEFELDDLLIVGGTGVINADVEALLSAYAAVERISGGNRYETALALARRYAPVTNLYYIATGSDFPDAITGAVLAAKKGTGVILVQGSLAAPSPVVQDFFAAEAVRYVRLFGGSSVISINIEDWFWDYIQ